MPSENSTILWEFKTKTACGPSIYDPDDNEDEDDDDVEDDGEEEEEPVEV